METFLTKRPREHGSTPSPSKAAKTASPIVKPNRQPKPAVHEYVGDGAVGALLDEATLERALQHLANDPLLAPLVEEARGAQLISDAPAQHANFIYLSEVCPRLNPRPTTPLRTLSKRFFWQFVVRRRIAVKAATTLLGTLKNLASGEWTPANVIKHELALKTHMKSAKSLEKVDTLVALARLFAQPGLAQLYASKSDRAIVEDKRLNEIKGIGPVAVRTLLVRMGRPDVLVAGDFLLNKWLEEAHGIPNDATNAESERKRIDAAKPWAPWRSVAYLVVARAAGATSAPVLA